MENTKAVIGAASPVAPAARRGSLASVLADGYRSLFGRLWPAWVGGLLLAFGNFALFTYASPWFIYGGINLAGSWLISFAGIKPGIPLVNVLTSTAFVQDMSIILGALISCLLASSFRIRMPQRKIRLLDGFAGGLMMGVGAMLAPGCNIGALFSAIASLSLSGFVSVFALGGGAYVGVLITRWRVKRDITSGMLDRLESKKALVFDAPPAGWRRWRQPLIGMALLLVSVVLFELAFSADVRVAVYLLFGLFFGFVLQRSGFCFTASFRDMFTSGDGRMARGVILAIFVAMLGFTVLQNFGIRQPSILPVGWHTLAGGFLFGLGMVTAGGCATGMLMRVGEGSVQLLFAIVGGMLGAGLLTALRAVVTIPNGPRIWLVNLVGGQMALAIGLAFLAVWLIAVQWNEARRRAK